MSNKNSNTPLSTKKVDTKQTSQVDSKRLTKGEIMVKKLEKEWQRRFQWIDDDINAIENEIGGEFCECDADGSPCDNCGGTGVKWW